MTALTAVAGFLWLAILIGLTLADYASRGQILAVRQPGGQVLRVPGK
jgi:hypothetical protein